MPSSNEEHFKASSWKSPAIGRILLAGVAEGKAMQLLDFV